MAKTLILVRGLPGSGKTTFARILGAGPVISADDYFMHNGKYIFKPEELGRAHKSCQAETAAYMYEGRGRVYVANTFTTESEMKPYFDLAKKYAYIVFTVIVENRHGGSSVHNVPEASVQAMKNRFSIKL